MVVRKEAGGSWWFLSKVCFFCEGGRGDRSVYEGVRISFRWIVRWVLERTVVSMF